MTMKHKKTYFIGIGGIGMSALAQLLKFRGVEVSGSDREASPVTEMLMAKGIAVAIGTDVAHVPPDTKLVIYSDAVWEDNVERMRAKELSIPQQSYFEALGEVSREYTALVVTGTHGKTTTTGMLGKILIDAGREPTVVVGSLLKDLDGSNFRAGASNLLVVEGCEYRRHFLHFVPQVLVINNLEWDHTDYYQTFADMQAAFKELAERVPEDGAIVTNPNDANIASILGGVRAQIIDYTREGVGELLLPGDFNKDNARAALAAARAAQPDLDVTGARASLAEFNGAWRRFEYIGKTKSGADVYDDYAHHPTAIKKTIRAAREKFPEKKLMIAFHPHLYSRTRDLMDGFAEALALADGVILAPIYPAREAPIEGVTSKVLAEKISALGTPARACESLDDVYMYFSSPSSLAPSTLLFTMGAGDIYKIGKKLTECNP